MTVCIGDLKLLNIVKIFMNEMFYLSELIASIKYITEKNYCYGSEK